MFLCTLDQIWFHETLHDAKATLKWRNRDSLVKKIFYRDATLTLFVLRPARFFRARYAFMVFKYAKNMLLQIFALEPNIFAFYCVFMRQ